MATNTRGKIDERLDRLESHQAQIQSTVESHHQASQANFAAISTELQAISLQMAALKTSSLQTPLPIPTSPSSTSGLSHQPPNHQNPTDLNRASDSPLSPSVRHLKLDVPRFNGNDPLEWIPKIVQYFDFHNVPDEQRIRLASFYFEVKAYSWYQWMDRHTRITDWRTFLSEVATRFRSAPVENVEGLLAKLTQSGSVLEYQEQFEALSERVTGFSPTFLLNCFLSGLKPSIRY